MAFVATIDPASALAPDYAGTKKIEWWTAVAGANDTGPGTVVARHITQIDAFSIESFNGSAPTTYSLSGNKLIVTLLGPNAATSYRIRLEGRY